MFSVKLSLYILFFFSVHYNNWPIPCTDMLCEVFSRTFTQTKVLPVLLTFPLDMWLTLSVFQQLVTYTCLWITHICTLLLSVQTILTHFYLF